MEGDVIGLDLTGCTNTVVTNVAVFGAEVGILINNTQNMVINSCVFYDTPTAVRGERIKGLIANDCRSVPIPSVDRKLYMLDGKTNWMSETSMKRCIKMLREGIENGNVRS